MYSYSDFLSTAQKPRGFDSWNRPLRGAYAKGWHASKSGRDISECPYTDKRKDCGRLTWSRAYIRAWEDGFRDADNLTRQA